MMARAAVVLFPCLLPKATAADLSAHWPPTDCPISSLVIRGHRFKAKLGFLPPGLFPTLTARLARLPKYCVHSSRLWSDAAVLHFRKARVLLQVDVEAATLDVTAAAPADAWLFVGAAKGQASVVRWLAHLIKHFLRSYEQIEFEESWMCPSPECHGLSGDGGGARSSEANATSASVGAYRGREFALMHAKPKAYHVCDQEGCWGFLGKGHTLEPMRLVKGEEEVCEEADEELLCTTCGKVPYFPLRAGGGFGWASKEDAELMRAGMSIGVRDVTRGGNAMR